MGKEASAAGGFSRQFHPQTYSFTLDKVQQDSGMTLANQWPGWYRGFKHYAITTGLFTKENNVQVNNLTNAMGSCADEILTTLRVDEETIEYKELIKQIEHFFKVRRNILAERQKFNKRIHGRKEDGRTVEETIETFINGLYALAETCKYDTLKDEFIRDRIIAGVKDERLSDILVQQDDLTLTKAVDIVRKWEARETDLKAIRGESSSSQVDFVDKRKNHGNNHRPTHLKNNQNQGQSTNQSKSEKCWFCAGTRHPRSICPARNAQCQKCSKIGHYAIACNSGENTSQRSVHEVKESQENVHEIFYIGEINSTNNSWEAEIHTNDNPTTWKLDTGAEACVLSDKVPWLGNQPQRRMKHQLRGAGGVNLPVIGVFDGILRYASKQIRKQIFVVKNQRNSLLSKSACVELGLIKLPKRDEINEINQNQNPTKSRSGNAEDSKKSSEPDFHVEFPELFSGLGRIKMDPYKTTLKPNAEPYYNGIKADPEKRRAIINFPTPGNITDLQRFNGMVSQLRKFIPGLA